MSNVPFFKQTLFVILISLLVSCTTPNPPATPAIIPTAAAPTSQSSPVSTATTPPQPTTAPTKPAPNLFAFAGRDPVIPHAELSHWDGKYINPGALFFHDGQFHMFRNGFKNWPGEIFVGYMTSTDGYIWTELQDEPLFSSTIVPYAAPGIAISSGFVQPDGTWTLFFHTVNEDDTPAVIGRLTAPNPLGPWSADPEPILTPDANGAWDEANLLWPSAHWHNNSGYLFFAGENRNGLSQIGLATSSDGVSWEKFNLPNSNDTATAASDPVFAADTPWQRGNVNRPEIVPAQEGWIMLYQAGSLNQRGLAWSSDGRSWTNHPDNPVLTSNSFPKRATTAWDTALVTHNNRYFYYLEIGTLAATDIYLTTHDGPLIPPN